MLKSLLRCRFGRHGGKRCHAESARTGTVEVRNEAYRGRWFEDVAGQPQRVKGSVVLGFVKEMKKSEARGNYEASWKPRASTAQLCDSFVRPFCQAREVVAKKIISAAKDWCFRPRTAAHSATTMCCADTCTLFWNGWDSVKVVCTGSGTDEYRSW